MFGDEETHRRYTAEQFARYVLRFGAGMVIYWFGKYSCTREVEREGGSSQLAMPPEIPLLLLLLLLLLLQQGLQARTARALDLSPVLLVVY